MHRAFVARNRRVAAPRTLDEFMHVSAQDILLSLLIGGEVFAIAALWPLSEWAVAASRTSGLAAALAVIAACIALDTHGLAFPAMASDTWHWSIAHALEWMTPPLFIAFPDAVCIASAQSLIRAGVPARSARRVALAVAMLAAAVAPFASVVAGCGLGGACL
jgi:hypothetical protein